MIKNAWKSTVEKTAREFLFSTPLFPMFRGAYQSVFDRQKFVSRKQFRGFYGQFISSGDLVFDVGANVGDYSDTFLALGAHVIAIEPNPTCCASNE